MTLCRAIKEFITAIVQIKKYSKNTACTYERILNKFAGFLARRGIADIMLITQDTILDFIADIQVSKILAVNTIRLYFHVIMSFCNFCVMRKYMPFSPAIGLPVPKKENKQRAIPTDEEFQKLIDTEVLSRKDNWFGIMQTVIMRIFCCLGLRFFEALSIKMSDINLAEKRLIVHGKGNSHNILCIPDKLFIPLSQYIQVRPKVKTDYLFISRDCRSRLGRSALYKIFRSHIKRCRIHENKYTPHTLRHAFSKRLYKTTKDIFLVYKVLRHKDISTTQLYIDHMTADDMSEGLNSAF